MSLPLLSLALLFSESSSKLFSLFLGLTFKMLNTNIQRQDFTFLDKLLDVCFYEVSERSSGNLKIFRYWLIIKEWFKLLNAFPNWFEQWGVSRSNSQYKLWLVELSKYLKILLRKSCLNILKNSAAATLFFFLSSLSAQHSNDYILLEKRKIKNVDTHNQWHCIHVHN